MLVRGAFIERSCSIIFIGISEALGLQEGDQALRLSKSNLCRWRISRADCQVGQPTTGPNRQTEPERLSCAAKTLDRRANLRLAWHQPPPGKGRRTICRHKRSHHENSYDQTNGPQNCSISLFLNRLLGFCPMPHSCWRDLGPKYSLIQFNRSVHKASMTNTFDAQLRVFNQLEVS